MFADGHGDESNFWSSSPRSDTPSPGISQSPVVGPYQIYTPISYGNGEHRATFRNSKSHTKKTSLTKKLFKSFYLQILY